MELSLSLDAREVLFHLNYMGYRNISKEQLKSFMIDLKKLIKYESQPQKSTTEVNFQAGPHSINIQRLFESHTAVSKLKQREKHPIDSKNPQKPIDKSKESQQKPKTDVEKKNPHKHVHCKHHPQKKASKDENQDKENIPKHENQPKDPKTNEKEQPKSKMWIRPKSAQSTRSLNPAKRNDPVALYQQYQKDWEKFRSNICEASRSDLRWTIRERMMSNH